MKIIKDFYGFGKDGYEQNDGIVTNGIVKQLDESSLNTKDIIYIKNMQTGALNSIGKRLDIEHYQVFYQKQEAGLKSADQNRKYYKYKGMFYNMRELEELSGLDKSTIYGRLNRKWSLEKIIDTPLFYNSKYFKKPGQQ